MAEFWESSFVEKQEMWGMSPADSAISALKLFKQHGLKNILVPGFGYGRNAAVFSNEGMNVTGIEISETAINLAKKHFGNNIHVFHGSVNQMPFEEKTYDAIFCYALIHLLSENERLKFYHDCFSHLKSGGYMFLVTLSTNDKLFGEGKKINVNTYESPHGVKLFFYDDISIKHDFSSYGLDNYIEFEEPNKNNASQPSRVFWQIICKKP